MRGLAIFSAVLLCLILFIVGVGALLPKRHVVSYAATYSQSPERLCSLIAGPQSWRLDVAHEESKTDSTGRTLSQETDKRGRTVVYEVRVLEPDRKLSRRITNQDLPYSGTWTYILQPIGAMTKVTLTEDGEVYNPAFRFLGRFVIGYETTIRNYLVALGKAGGEEVKPRREPAS